MGAVRSETDARRKRSGYGGIFYYILLIPAKAPCCKKLRRWRSAIEWREKSREASIFQRLGASEKMMSNIGTGSAGRLRRPQITSADGYRGRDAGVAAAAAADGWFKPHQLSSRRDWRRRIHNACKCRVNRQMRRLMADTPTPFAAAADIQNHDRINSRPYRNDRFMASVVSTRSFGGFSATKYLPVESHLLVRICGWLFRIVYMYIESFLQP